MIKSHPAYKYAEGCLNGEINAPVYVKKQCAQFVKIANGDDDKYCIDENKVDVIGKLLKVLVVPKGLRAGNSVHDIKRIPMAFYNSHIMHSTQDG